MAAITSFATPFNNFLSYVVQNRSIAGASLAILDVTGLTLTGSQWLRVSVLRGSTPIAILKATAVTPATNTLTISGAAEGSDANILIGDVVFVGGTAGTFSDIYTAVNTNERKISGYSTAIYSFCGGL